MKRSAIFSREDTSKYRANGIEWDFHDEDTQEHLHALHPYPARFIPQIPRKAILKWSKHGNRVLDPFCGCGTTLLESIILGRPAIGIDNNSVAYLVSKTKTVPYTKRDLNTLMKFSEKLKNSFETKKSFGIWNPGYESLLYWFDKRAVLDLGRLKWLIDQLPERPRLLALSVFSSIIVRASYQDSDTRYAKVDRDYVKGNAIKWFQMKLSDTIGRVSEVIGIPKANCKVYLADSRNLSFIPDESIDLIITSPPYLNAYDYHKYHRHRLHWIEGDIELARNVEIGKHDIFTRPKATPDRFFDDMERCFSEWQRVLRRKGRAFVVTGDAIVNGKPVAVGDKFVDICEALDLRCEDRWIRKLKKTRKSFNQNSRIEEEHLLLFRRQ